MRFLKFLLIISLGFSVNAQAVDKFIIPRLKDVIKPMGEGTNPALNPDRIQVTVWNMFKGDKDNFVRDFNTVTKNSDILMLQETFLDDKMKGLFKNHTGFEYITATSFIFENKNVETGLATASHTRSTAQAFLRSQDREPVVKTPKIVLMATYPIQGKYVELLTVNIHAVNFVTTAAFKRQLFSTIPRVKSHIGPVIFAGDFNTWSDERLELLDQYIKELGLKEVPWTPDTRMRTFKRPLDHILYRGLNLVESRVWGELDGSDHKALEAVFTY
ncbi:MAG: endonuclease/exonuclease/phosphatase family protein [Bdellovibrio sp.]